MRLTCPNCNAQYEVPDEVIPESGRDVQCSNCEKTWFQPKHPDTASEGPEPSADTAPQPDAVKSGEDEHRAEPDKTAAATSTARRSSVDPAVADILQQEAAREAELRAKEGTSLESQPDLGLDAPAKPVQKAKPHEPTETASDAGQKDALPDVDSINSTLRNEEPAPKHASPDQPPRNSRGFIRGFGLIVILGVVLFLVYGNARQISQAVPQAEPMLNSYVSLVDQARVWLETQAGSAAE